LFIFGFAVFCLGAVLSLPTSSHAADAAGALARFAYTTIVWFGLGAIVLRNRRHVEIAVAAWILAVAMSGLAAIAQVLFGQGVLAPLTIPVPTFFSRQVGLSQHPNDLGGASAIVVASAILFAASTIWTGARRYVFTGLLGLVVAGIALSGSVTAFGAAAVSATIWLVSGRVAVKRWIVVGGALALMSVALVLINQLGASSVLSPIDRVSLSLGLTTTPLATGLDRLNLDAIAWNLVVRNPLVGVGLDLVSIADVMGGVDVHNMFLFTWLGAGFFGFLGLVLMVVALGGSYVGQYRHSVSSAERSLIVSLGTSFLAFLIVASSEPVLFIRFGWVPAALLLPLRASRLRRERAARGTTFVHSQL
jgi:O-antigen ligase